MLNRRQFLATGTGAALALGTPVWAEGPLTVVATTGMIADTALRVGGELVSVTPLMGPGIDPHSYRQTRSDIVAMTRADLVLWHGLFLEAQMQPFFERLANRQPVVAVTDQLEADARSGATSDLMASEDYADAFDPHIWMDPKLWTHVSNRIALAMAELRPDTQQTLLANAAAFNNEILALDTFARAALSQIPTERRVLVTAHDAFSYFGAAYDIDVLGVQGISTESEAGLHRIRELVDILVDRQIDAVFVESSVSDRNMRALIEGAAAKGHTVRLGGELFSDAMGPLGTYEGTYVGMMDHNITTIARALGADVPPTGYNGRLIGGS